MAFHYQKWSKMTGEEVIVLTADNLPVKVDQVAIQLEELQLDVACSRELRDDLDDVFYEGTQTGHGETVVV